MNCNRILYTQNEDERKTVENEKREMLLQAKEEIHKNRVELEREIKERRNEMQRLERRVLQKEEGLDKKSNQKYVIRYDLSGNELARFGSINEACQQLIDNNEVKTKLVKTARNAFLRNYKKIWLNSKWEVIENNNV